jgi:apolipoprotein N-acyltransferase
VRIGKAAKVAGAGFIAFWVAVGWMWMHEHLEKRHDPPGWIIDRAVYQPAAMLGRIGALVFVIASVIGIGNWVASRVIRILRSRAVSNQ